MEAKELRGFPADISVSAVRRPGGQLRGAARRPARQRAVCWRQCGRGEEYRGRENTVNTMSMGPHLAPVILLLANIALAASELSTSGRY